LARDHDILLQPIFEAASGEQRACASFGVESPKQRFLASNGFGRTSRSELFPGGLMTAANGRGFATIMGKLFSSPSTARRDRDDDRLFAWGAGNRNRLTPHTRTVGDFRAAAEFLLAARRPPSAGEDN
jgi:hypothetical protein